MPPKETKIRERCYLLWEGEGRPEGRALDHWLRAEAELRAEEATEIRQDPRRRARTGNVKDGGAGATTKSARRLRS